MASSVLTRRPVLGGRQVLRPALSPVAAAERL